MSQMTGTLELIENAVSNMSKGHRAIANFILESYDKAAYMTAAKLGEEVGVSESTVVRFTTELGFEGYPEFQKALQEDLKSKLTSVQRLGLTEKFESDSEALKSVVAQDISNHLTPLMRKNSKVLSIPFSVHVRYISWESGHQRLYQSSCTFI